MLLRERLWDGAGHGGVDASVWLKIESADDDYRVTWGSGPPHPVAYTLDKNRIRNAAKKVREILERLAQWSGSEDHARRRGILIDLAAAGTNFRYQLFNHPAKRQEIKALQSWIQDEYDAGDHQLEIQADSSIQIPWGLIFDGSADDPQTPPALDDISGELQLFRGFWCLKYELIVTSGVFVRPRSSLRRPRRSFGLLTLLNADVEQEIHNHVNGCELATLDEECQLFVRPIGTARTLDECQTLLSERDESSDIVFYFLGHHSDATLELGGGETIDDGEFSRLMDMLAERIESGAKASCGLVFLNGCASAVGEQNINLRYYIERPELCGVIATEAIVPTEYAHRFGVRFLNLLVRAGEPICKVLQTLYHDPTFWPECLLYGCYAHALYQIEKPPAPPADTPDLCVTTV